jgi:predicted metal-binding protein
MHELLHLEGNVAVVLVVCTSCHHRMGELALASKVVCQVQVIILIQDISNKSQTDQ